MKYIVKIRIIRCDFIVNGRSLPPATYESADIPPLNPEPLSNITDESSNQVSNPKLNNIEGTLSDLNSIKNQLTQIPLNPLQLNYFNNSVVPLLTSLENLSTISLNLSTTASYLSTSIVMHEKESKLKDTLHLVYKINEDCEDIYHILKRRIETLLYLEDNK